jgi:hypothetical protein
MRKLLWAIAGAWVLLLVTLWLFEHALMTDEKRVLRRVEQMRSAAEAGRTLTLADYIANDYRDDWDLDKRGLLGAFATMRREHPDLELRVERITARVNGGKAEADVRGSATDKNEVIERGAFILKLRKVDKEWKLTGIFEKEQKK